MKPLHLLIAVLLFSITNSVSQTETDSHTLTINLNTVAHLEINSTNSNAISLKGTAPNDAGEKVELNQSNNDLWLNYSSIAKNNSARNVTVQVIDGEVPEGINLMVSANKYLGDGEGHIGKVVEQPIILNDKKATNIIEGIGSAYTGNGAKKGHNLTYKIAQSDEANSYAFLDFDDSTTLTIVYTLSDN
ncbi:hypothetical protein SAMN05444411_101599 [Lutibacter oricola]|uniref:Uncharacterized protein n=1 Tax=Lutibacter oricola TaxID=762486 RepID=A0A1H2T1P3_9FLAO|nr:hypothetical protein [Lutibacter oricola]SDW37778.1 hypothetical protein SAMN05444411_101599 [Lutibacter oricola]